MGRHRQLPVVEIGKSYCGKRGKLIRTVIDVGMHIRPEYYNGKRLTGEKNEWLPIEPGIKFMENGREKMLMMSSFENWMGRLANLSS